MLWGRKKNDDGAYSLAMRMERDDANSCPLCRDRNTRIIAKADPAYAAWRDGCHDGCRGMWVGLSVGNPSDPHALRANWMDPPEGRTEEEYRAKVMGLVRAHGSPRLKEFYGVG
jgi:hypothetical protein